MEYTITTTKNGKTFQTTIRKNEIGRLERTFKIIHQMNIGERICECGKLHTNKRSKCNTCVKRAQIASNPMKYAFYNLRTNAKRRNIFFDLKFEDFQEFCFETSYMQGKGKTASSYSVDRIIESLGYTKGNLQVLTLAENTQKENERRKRLVCHWETGKRNEFTFQPLPTFENQFSHVPF